MPVCRHCSRFYQAGSNHDAVCPATRVQIPDCPEPRGRIPHCEENILGQEEEITIEDLKRYTPKDPSLLAKVFEEARTHFRERWKRFRAKRRLPHICAKWNREIGDRFAEDVAEQRADPDFEVDGNIAFKWNQLVWQEILMWNSLNEPVTRDEYLFICDRRGFSSAQRRYLKEMLEFMKLKGWKE